MAGHHICW